MPGNERFERVERSLLHRAKRVKLKPAVRRDGALGFFKSMVSNNENRWSQIHLNPVQQSSEFGALKTQQEQPTKGSGGLPSTLGVKRSALLALSPISQPC
mmetsp:Transcript_8624/g.28776  ORF Transcript_8624/g.28776 Transcript_8624/m.28776 type:complete len:100 (-) Transcript_8624:1222-1521(-)